MYSLHLHMTEFLIKFNHNLDERGTRRQFCLIVESIFKIKSWGETLKYEWKIRVVIYPYFNLNHTQNNKSLGCPHLLFDLNLY